MTTKALQTVDGWQNTNDLLRDIHKSVRDFEAGRTDCEVARVTVSHFKAATAVLALELEHARVTKRLIEHSPNLPALMIAGDTSQVGKGE